METAYWLGRERASLANARGATGAEARLIHYELAGRYSIKAANSASTRPVGITS
jgi:hypothetical protein